MSKKIIFRIDPNDMLELNYFSQLDDIDIRTFITNIMRKYIADALSDENKIEHEDEKNLNTKRIRVRVSPSEQQAVDCLCQKNKTALSALVKKRCIENPPKEYGADSETLKNLYDKLYRSGKHLNSFTYLVNKRNANGLEANQVMPVLREVNEKMNDLNLELKSLSDKLAENKGGLQ